MRWNRVALLMLAVAALTLIAVRSASADRPPRAAAAVTTRPAATATPTAAPASSSADCLEVTARPHRQAPALAQSPARRTVALTFDDGPGEYTQQVLAILRRYRVRATFFMIGKAAAANPRLVHDVAADGDQIGNHSWSHRPPTAAAGWRTAVADTEIGRAEAVLRSESGADVCWFRPPAGIVKGLAPAVRSHHQAVALWSVDTRDWAVQRPGISVAQAVSTITANAAAGLHQKHPVLLMHDGGGRRDATVAALPQVIESYRSAGYDFVRLDGA